MLDIKQKKKECFTVKGKQRFELIESYLLNNNCLSHFQGYYSEASKSPLTSMLHNHYFIIEGELTDALLAKLFEIGMKVKKAKQGTYFQG